MTTEVSQGFTDWFSHSYLQGVHLGTAQDVLVICKTCNCMSGTLLVWEVLCTTSALQMCPVGHGMLGARVQGITQKQVFDLSAQKIVFQGP